jgi:hypothetical protein
MASERQEQVRIERNDGFERRQKVVAHAPSTRTVLVSRVSKLIWLIASVINVLLALRFVLKLIAANPGNPFTDFMYSVTGFLVGPFVGIVNTPVAQSGATVDVAALFAMVVYTILALVIVQLIRILFASSGGTKAVTTVERLD